MLIFVATISLIFKCVFAVSLKKANKVAAWKIKYLPDEKKTGQEKRAICNFDIDMSVG